MNPEELHSFPFCCKRIMQNSSNNITKNYLACKIHSAGDAQSLYICIFFMKEKTGNQWLLAYFVRCLKLDNGKKLTMHLNRIVFMLWTTVSRDQQTKQKHNSSNICSPDVKIIQFVNESPKKNCLFEQK